MTEIDTIVKQFGDGKEHAKRIMRATERLIEVQEMQERRAAEKRDYALALRSEGYRNGLEQVLVLVMHEFGLEVE